MYRLVYVSSASADLTDEDIKTILHTSQSNNNERFVTGFLAHNGDSFMQALEGEREEVQDTYLRIIGDRRHFGITQILGERVETRAFPTWSMEYHRVDKIGGSPTMIADGADTVDSLMNPNMPRDLLYLFSKFMRMS